MKFLRIAREGRIVAADTGVVDGYRGLAIALVLIYHSWLFSWFTPELTILGRSVPIDAVARTGYLGVELFFCISAFVLFLPRARRSIGCEREAPTEIRRFANRRFIKIVPSFAIALAFTFVSAASLHIAVPFVPTLAQHVFFVPNFVTSELGRANSVFWSLGIEVQFYLVFPALARAFVRRPIVVAASMVATALAYRYGVATCCLESETINRQVPAFLDVFGCGMLAAYAVAVCETRYACDVRMRALATLGAGAALAAGFALVLSASAIAYDVAGRERWILANRTSVALAAGFALFTTPFAATAFRAVVANPLARFLSTISYNLYLWHTLVLVWLWKHRALPATTADPHEDPHWKALYLGVGWTLSIGIASAVTYFVERPLLATVKPQSFAFTWRKITTWSAVARSETNT